VGLRRAALKFEPEPHASPEETARRRGKKATKQFFVVAPTGQPPTVCLGSVAKLRSRIEEVTITKQLMIEMFTEMVIKKDANLIGRYYHPDFELETNGQRQNYAAFVGGHERVYASSISYDVRYDEASWIESGNKVAARMWIRTRRAEEAPTEIEVVLIAHTKANVFGICSN
jgi:hypothetical protein